LKKKTRCYIYTRVWIIWMLQIFITIKNFRFTETIRYPI